MSSITRRSFLGDVLAGGATLWLGTTSGLAALLSSCARKSRSKKAKEPRPLSQQSADSRADDQHHSISEHGEQAARRPPETAHQGSAASAQAGCHVATIRVLGKGGSAVCFPTLVGPDRPGGDYWMRGLR